MRITLAAACALALAGCETVRARLPSAEPQPPPAPVVAVRPPEVVEVEPPAIEREAPARRSCVPRSLGPPPRYPDSDRALRDAAGAADRYQLMAAGRIMRQKRLEELERIIAGCR